MLRLFLVLIFLTLISSSTSLAADDFDARKVCAANKGVWREFGSDCADNCSLNRPQDKICARNITFSCDCLKDRCWDYYHCVDNKSFIASERKLEKERIAKLKAENPSLFFDLNQDEIDEEEEKEKLKNSETPSNLFQSKINEVEEEEEQEKDEKPKEEGKKDSGKKTASTSDSLNKIIIVKPETNISQASGNKTENGTNLENNKPNPNSDSKVISTPPISPLATPENKDNSSTTKTTGINPSSTAIPPSDFKIQIEACTKSGGTWKDFPNGCADTCLSKSGPAFCAEVLTPSCDCKSETKCWSGSTCTELQ